MQGDLAPQRRRLRNLAYRLLGSVSEADDVVQDAWLRWQKAEDVQKPEAWLTTTVTRLCLDRLKSARRQRELYVGPWLPEPVTTTGDEADLESISLAFLLLLERLSPVERAVYLLSRVFELSHAEIAATLQRTEPSVRKTLERASHRLSAARPRFAPSKEQHAALLLAFAAACSRGDLAELKQLLASDAEAWTDGGGTVRAARNVVRGGEDVARLFVGLSKKFPVTTLPELCELNGLPSLVLRRAGQVEMAISIETDGATVFAVHVVLNPYKLARLVL